MAHEEQKLCDSCHERLATFHSTTSLGTTTQTKDFCMTCWAQLASPQELASHRRFQEIVANGKCKYCGDPAVGGAFSGGLTTMAEQVDLWCEPCRADFEEFMSQPENVMADDFPDDEAAMEQYHQRLTTLTAEADAYVRQRAAERAKKRTR